MTKKHTRKADATGRLLFKMLGAIGQFVTEIRAERQMDGILKAKGNGIKFGCSKALSHQGVLVLQQKRASGLQIKELMREYGLSKATIYRHLGNAMG
ncbi:serine integrase family protein [Megalodesulfovibrio gigas]|uniref:Putative site-specific recombinase n=1 Tax=Megalodesulfovibrio gigas (strain ATCC 19364 / DSM 1382 / NCIMB 9332 / VKM B-1759) TaxID=1121448 RepID=T2GFH7_MEGG1|nr:recombinase family protein [Megalodesulfovibrio gigas]AGW15043.1 putative site-specific recombinase [Megalodesulfovibrio gigas DSM 1382 = ATCC 19364]